LAQQQIGADLRQHPRTRVPIPFPCSFMPLNAPPWWGGSSDGLGVVFDISLNGIKLMSENLPPPGEQLALMVRLPHQQSSLNLDVATVRWRTSGTIGLEFSTLSESAAERLREFIAHTPPDLTGPMRNVAQISDGGRGKVENLGYLDKIPDPIQPEHSIQKPQEDAVVLNRKRGRESVLLEATPVRRAVKVRKQIYRSHVSSLVRWSMFLIALFVLCKAWWKPSYWPTPQQPTQSAHAPAVGTPPTPDRNTRAEGTVTALPRTRLLDPGHVPSSSLNAIRAELRKELDVQVESVFQKRSRKAPAQTGPDLRPSSQIQTAKIHTQALQGKKQFVVADLSRMPAGEKMDASPAAEIGPSRRVIPVSVNFSVKAPFIPVIPAEKPGPQPRTNDTSHFTVLFDGGEDQATWIRMRAILEYAYQEIGQKFGYVPDAPIKVVLHMKQKFSGEMGTPAWADTLFDQASGTIHIPVGQALDDLAWFSRVVRHEFVHALLHARMNTQPTVAPTWLVEGLAIQLAEDPWSDLDEVRKKRHPFMPLASLQGRWKGISADSLPMAYVEADLATRSLTERYGIHGVRQVLSVLRAGQSLDAAMQAKLSLSYDKFHQQWAKDFKVNLRQGMS